MKKFIALVLVAMLAMFALTAGGAKEKTGADETRTTFSIIHYMAEQSKQNAISEIVDTFEAANPGVKINLEYIDSSDFFTVYQTRINAGDAPDIFFGSPREMKEYVEADLFMDLSGAPFIDAIREEVLEETMVNGKYYAVPLDVQIKAVFYNKTMFAKRGLEVPRTYNELLNVIDVFSKERILPFIHPYSFVWAPYHEIDVVMVPMARAYGGDSGAAFEKAQNGELILANDPYMQKAAELWDLICRYQDRADITTDQPTAFEQFAAGERPMYINGGWMYADVVAMSDDEFGFFPFPWSNNPDENVLVVSLDDAFIVSNSTKHKDVIFSFLEFMMTKEGAEIWMRNADLLSSSKRADVRGMSDYVQLVNSYTESGLVAKKAAVPDFTAAYSDAQLTTMQSYIVENPRNPMKLLRDLDAAIAFINR